jgi:hypothetical protein
MQERVTQLSDDDRAYLDELRKWLRGHFLESECAKYDEIGGKLAVVQTILQNRWFDPNEAWQLHALGVGMGDALAQQLGMVWMIVQDEHGRQPILQLPGTSLKLGAFTMIQKRVVEGEDVDVPSLFEAFCHSVEQIRAPKRSLFGRLFGSRLR